MLLDLYCATVTVLCLGLAVSIVVGHHKHKDALTLAENVIRHLLDKLEKKPAVTVPAPKA